MSTGQRISYTSIILYVSLDNRDTILESIWLTWVDLEMKWLNQRWRASLLIDWHDIQAQIPFRRIYNLEPCPLDIPPQHSPSEFMSLVALTRYVWSPDLPHRSYTADYHLPAYPMISNIEVYTRSRAKWHLRRTDTTRVWCPRCASPCGARCIPESNQSCQHGRIIQLMTGLISVFISASSGLCSRMLTQKYAYYSARSGESGLTLS